MGADEGSGFSVWEAIVVVEGWMSPFCVVSDGSAESGGVAVFGVFGATGAGRRVFVETRGVSDGDFALGFG